MSTIPTVVIRQAKIEIRSSDPDAGCLSYKFAHLTNVQYDIGGNNVFVGLCGASARSKALGKDTDGFAVLRVNSRSDWKKAWENLGAKQPGDLPRGACAMFFFTRASQATHSGVNVGWIDRHFGPLGSSVSVRWDTHEERICTEDPPQQSFGVVIVPKTLGGVSYSVSYGASTSAVINSFLTRQNASASARRQRPSQTN